MVKVAKKRHLNMLPQFLVLIMAFGLLSVFGCAATPKKGDAEKTDASASKDTVKPRTVEWLKERLQRYAHAMSVNDFDATYQMESETTREKLDFDRYLKMKYSSHAEQEVYKISRIQYDRRKNEYLVKIKVTLVNLPAGMKIALADTKGDWWKYENGDWFRKGPEKKKKYKPKKEKASDNTEPENKADKKK